MKIQRKREIVIEFECVRLVRKKARTHVTVCRRCGREADFLSLGDAAALFATPADSLLCFVRGGGIHFEARANGETDICLTSLLAAMKANTNRPRVKLLEDLPGDPV